MMTPHFNYQHQALYAENVALSELALHVGTPCYVYSKAALTERWQAFQQALGTQPHLIAYAVKANSNLAILNLFARLGSGFDIVSMGELERVLAAGGEAQRIVFSGVGKQAHEIERALSVGIRCFNVESRAELLRINQIASHLGVLAPISLRINPDIDAKTHPYIATGLRDNKFGIAYEEALEIYQLAASLPHLQILGIDCHIGSQLTELSPFLEALQRLLILIDQLAACHIHLSHLDIGGGLGVCYQQENPPPIADYLGAILTQLKGRNLELIIEPGRALVAEAGLLLTRVEYLKPQGTQHFAIVDAAMNDLLRPALYQAWHTILPVEQQAYLPVQNYHIVGPVCESGDFLAKDRPLQIAPGALLAIMTAGAYGFCMSSNYNTRPKVAEVMVDGSAYHIIRSREQLHELWAHEHLLP